MPKVFWDSVWIGLFCIIVAALGFEALTASQMIPEQQHSNRSESAKKATDTPSATLDGLHAGEQTRQRKEKQAQAAEHVLEFFNIKLTDALIAIFTVVLAYKTAGLFRETAGLRRAADQQARDMQASLAIAKQSADAATASASQIPIVERAYIFATPHPAVDGKRTIITLMIENYGQTPGIVTEGYGTTSLTEPVGQPLYPPRPLNPRSLEAVLGKDAKEPFPTKWESPVTDPHFFFGYIRYTDIFHKPHTTRFCAKIFPATGKVDMAGPPVWNSWN